MITKRQALFMKWQRFLRFVRWQIILSQEFWSRVWLKFLYRLESPAENFRKDNNMVSVVPDELEIEEGDFDKDRYQWHLR